MHASTPLLVLAVIAAPCSALYGTEVANGLEANRANPIRKVVNMLQSMQKKVEAEGKKEQELFDKFMCYCKTGATDLGASISAAEGKVPEVGSSIKEGEAKLAQLKADLKQHQVDRSAAKAAIEEATAVRNKAAAEYAKEAAESKANIAAMNGAVQALENGMAGGFLQTNNAQVLRHLADRKEMDEEERQALSAFLQGKQESENEYAPSSGEITGILKTMSEEMSKSLAEATAAEESAVKSFDELVAAKTKEIEALTAAIERKTVRVGELAVEIVQMKNDLSDTQQALEEDKKFLKDLDKNCAQKSAEWGEIVKTRQEELVALADTIKVLNDDDALDLFKKTLPGASASFVQLKSSSENLRQKAVAKLKAAHWPQKARLDFITLAIQGKKIGFEKVVKMIDDMVATLKKEQMDDDHKKEYCEKQFDVADDKKKGLERAVADLETVIAEAKEGIETTKTDIKTLEDGIKTLDKSVKEATEQRKQEHEDFTGLMSSDSAAKEILGFAKNRLNKFYNPSLYKEPATALNEEEQTVSFVQIKEHHTADPGPAPAAPGPYKKKGEESNGVIAMIDLLVKDLDKEMTEAKTAEKDAQADYETMMSDSATKRAEDAKALTDKESTLAELQSDLESNTETKGSTTKELMATQQYIQALHAECDWLIQYFSVRKEARDSEIDALGKAKAVLAGADFSLVQMQSGEHKFLKRA